MFAFRHAWLDTGWMASIYIIYVMQINILHNIAACIYLLVLLL